jgi:ATPase subunit of ABC transporter with duplicated ATPase domains
MLSFSGLAKHHGERVLFDDASATFAAGCRYGIIGANGSGKSTILRIVSGEEEASLGEIAIAQRALVGTLRQDHFAFDAVPILEVVLMGIPELHAAMVEKERLLEKADEGFDDVRYAELEDVIMRYDGYAMEAQAAEVLEGLNIPAHKHRQPLSTLSGGYKLRVLLAQTLAAKPDILLLDEPTNHLDILSIRWLEKFLCKYRGCVLVVSHDRRFLNTVATHIVDVDYERVTVYKGDYDAFELQKQEHRDRQESEIKKREDEIADHKAFIDRFRAKASKARQANSRQKRMEKIVIERLPESSRRFPRFRFQQARPSGRRVLEVEALKKAYGADEVLHGVTLAVDRGDRVAIIGPNGIGKTTLLEIATGSIAADAGTATWGYEAHVGVFHQSLDIAKESPNETILSWLWRHAPDMTPGFVRNKLAEVLFGREEVDKKLANLSGGEQSRLLLAQLGISGANVLVLDEPTNHLDLEGVEALAGALREYDGTLLFVSHNRWFVEQLATRIIEIRPDGITDYPGDYREYLAHCGDDHLDAEVATQLERARRKA